jgi:hypothetical protein
MPQTKWTNKDGLNVRFGRKDSVEENAVPATTVTAGTVQELTLYINATQLVSVANTRPDERGAVLPAGAIIEGVFFNVDEAFATSTSSAFALGTYTTTAGATDGSGADSDGLGACATANVATVFALGANPRVLPVAGSTTNLTGAQVGTKLSAKMYVAAAATTGSFTAGKAKVVIRYSVPTA